MPKLRGTSAEAAARFHASYARRAYLERGLYKPFAARPRARRVIDTLPDVILEQLSKTPVNVSWLVSAVRLRAGEISLDEFFGALDKLMVRRLVVRSERGVRRR